MNKRVYQWSIEKRSKTDERDDNSRCQLLSEEDRGSDGRRMELIIEVWFALSCSLKTGGEIVLREVC